MKIATQNNENYIKTEKICRKITEKYPTHINENLGEITVMKKKSQSKKNIYIPNGPKKK